MSTTRRQFLATTAAAALAHTAAAAVSRYQVGITTNTIGGWEKDPFLGFREAREVGYRNVESFISYFPEYYPDKPKELKKRLDEIGVGAVTFSNGGAPTEMHLKIRQSAKRSSPIISAWSATSKPSAAITSKSTPARAVRKGPLPPIWKRWPSPSTNSASAFA